MTPTEGSYRPRLALASVFAVYFSQAVVFVGVPLAADRSGISVSVTGLLLAVPGAISLLIDVPIASYSDGTGRRRSLLGGATILLAGALILAIPSPYALALGVGVFSIAMAWTVAPSLAAVTESSALDAQPRIQGWNGSVQAVAALTGAATAGLLFSAGTTIAFAPVIVAAIVVFLAALRLPRPGPRPRHSPWRSSYGDALRLLRLPGMRSVSILAAAYGIIFLVVGNAFVPLYLVSEGGFSPAVVGLFLAVRPVIVLLVSPSFGSVARRWGVVTPLAVVTVAAGVGIALVPIVSAVPVALAGALALQGLGIALSAAGANYLVTEVTERGQRATGIAVTNLGSRLTILVVPPILGLVYQTGGPASAFLVAALIVFVCAGALVMGPRSPALTRAI